MRIGFTGSRHGLTQDQRLALWSKLNSLYVVAKDVTPWLHHGDCVGADADAARLAKRAGFFIKAHPPLDERLRAFNAATLYAPAKPYLKRDRDIVEETELLIGCPGTMQEEPKGGTWYTIRYACRLGQPTYIIWPDGSVTDSRDRPA